MAAETDLPVKQKVVIAGGLILSVTTGLHVLQRWRRKDRFPSAAGWYPVVGHMITCMRYCWENSNLAMAKWGVELERTQGLKAYEADLQGVTVVMVQDADLVQEVLEGDPDRFTKNLIDAPVGGDLLGYNFRDGLLTAATGDPKWGVAHRVLLPSFSVRGVRGIMPMMCDQADLLVKAMKRDVGYGGTTYIDTWVTKMAFETIAVCGLGTSFGCFEDDQTHPFVKSLKKVVEAIDPLSRWPRWLRPIVYRVLLKDYVESSKYLRQTCLEILEKRRQEQKDSQKDLLDRMLSDADAKTGQQMTEESIVDNLLTFLLTGQDSTAASMASCLCYLCDNPSCKEKLLEEIDRVVGQEPLTYEHISDLTYLDWCIREALRLMPPTTRTQRQSTSEQILGKFRIPARTPVNINTMGLHYSADLWGPDVDEFKPERWAKESPHKFAFVPFSYGPRACIGREFTLLEQKVTMVKFFQNFDLELAPNQQLEGYSMLKPNSLTPPFLSFDAQIRTGGAFLGLFSNFRLLPREGQAHG